jgi:hypothetical protein
MKRKHTAQSDWRSLRVWVCPALICALSISIYANTITVTNTNDSGPGSLRQALADANDGDTIEFAVSGTIGLTSGELLVDKSITISGPGAKNLAIDGNAKDRVLHIGSGETVTISGLTITNGDATGNVLGGGGVYNDHSMLTINDCTISDNLAAQGGGICNDGQMDGAATVEINNCRINGNSAGLGAAIFNNAELSGYTSAQINSTSIMENAGPAIYSVACFQFGCGQATLQVDSSTLSGNSGGGIFADPRTDLGVTNSTLSDNGGGLASIVNYYIGSISNSTMNESSGNDIHNEGVVTINDAVLKVGPSGHSIVNVVGVGNVKSLGYNVSSDDGAGYLNGPGDQIDTDPMLGPLQDNGGPTFTHALLVGSPAINMGAPNFTPPPYYDQRGPGFDRVRNGRLDVGAFEVQEPLATPSATPTPTATSTITPTATPTATPSPTARPTPTARPNVTPRSRPTPAPRP